MASLTFTDSIGTVTLTNNLDTIAGGVGSRFQGWTPFQVPVGPAVTGLGTGQRFQFAFRTDYGASFRMTEMPVSRLPQVLRLQAHLLGGGIVRVQTDDVFGNVYDNCCLAPNEELQVELSDTTAMLYTVSLSLLNLDAEQMICRYSGTAQPDSVIFAWDVSLGVSDATFSRGSTATFVQLS